MTNENPEKTETITLTPVLAVKLSLPFLLSLLVLVLAFVMGWEPWFGYASVIAGALGSLMYAGHVFDIGG